MIEVQVPKDVSVYESPLVGPLTARQTVCVAVAAAIEYVYYNIVQTVAPNIDMNTLIIDAKSGTSGAGRGAKVQNLYCEVNESIKAYGVASHRHTPEIEEQLGYVSSSKVLLNFTPHLIPMNRGILITAYASLKEGVSEEDVKKTYDIYKDEYFVRVLKEGNVPEVRNVKCSNFVDVAYKVDPRTHRVIMMGAMDNLVKGAAGQAIQNMNIMFGLDEKTGLMLAPAVL